MIRPGAGPATPEPAAPGLRITLDLDRRAAEALRLELRRLARAHGLDPDAIRFVTAPAEPAT